jgi:hypothetical protein
MTLDGSDRHAQPLGRFRSVQIVDPTEQKGLSACRRQLIEMLAELAELDDAFDRRFRLLHRFRGHRRVSFTIGITRSYPRLAGGIDRQIGGDAKQIGARVTGGSDAAVAWRAAFAPSGCRSGKETGRTA